MPIVKESKEKNTVEATVAIIDQQKYEAVVGTGVGILEDRRHILQKEEETGQKSNSSNLINMMKGGIVNKENIVKGLEIQDLIKVKDIDQNQKIKIFNKKTIKNFLKKY